MQTVRKNTPVLANSLKIQFTDTLQILQKKNFCKLIQQLETDASNLWINMSCMSYWVIIDNKRHATNSIRQMMRESKHAMHCS